MVLHINIYLPYCTSSLYHLFYQLSFYMTNFQSSTLLFTVAWCSYRQSSKTKQKIQKVAFFPGFLSHCMNRNHQQGCRALSSKKTNHKPPPLEIHLPYCVLVDGGRSCSPQKHSAHIHTSLMLPNFTQKVILLRYCIL